MASDVAMMQSLQEKCRVIDFSKQPILLDCPNTHYHDRKGTLYLTAEFLIFYAPGSLFTSEELQLVPLKALIATATVIGGVATVLPPSILTLEKEKEWKRKLETDSTSSSTGKSFGHLDRVNMNHILLASGVSDCVCVVDEGGKVDSFRLSGATIDFCTRVADVINVMIQARFFENVQALGISDTTSKTSAGKRGGIEDKALDSIASAPLPHPPSSSSTVVVAAAGDAASEKKAKLGKNIQAFLEKSQKK